MKVDLQLENKVSVLNACTSLLRFALSDTDPEAVAIYLGFLRKELMEEGALNENVDMAVSLNGRVLPLDNLIKKDR